MYSQVPVVPLMKDNNILNIKIQTSLCIPTRSMFGVFQRRYDQWTLSESLLIYFSKACDMANTCTVSPTDSLLVITLLQKVPHTCFAAAS